MGENNTKNIDMNKKSSTFKRIRTKFSSYSKKKKFGIIFGIIIISMIISTAITLSLIQTEIVSDVETINPNGNTGKAFVAYRPGISFFQRDVTYAFIEGLKDNDWSIDVTTTSSQTPTDISNYDLVVFGSPTYGGKPHQSVTDYIEQLGNLGNKHVALVVTAGFSSNALTFLENLINNASGVVVKSLVLNLTGNIGGDTWQIRYQAGKSIN
jgi:flavorubredoxin